VNGSKLSSEDLKALLNSITPIPAAAWDDLATRLEPREFAAGDMLFRPGGTDARLHFLRQGLVRYYYLTDEGRELNHTFANEGGLVGCLPVFLGTGSCDMTVEALEPVSTLVVPAEIFQEPGSHPDYWQQVKLRLVEFVALRKNAREAEFLRDSAETRYRKFVTVFGPVAARIPKYHIASYLGITPVALSRIRKRINLG
jgi:CRP-like cAMP-binding protein